jgi:hypothetical protein
MAQSTQEPAIQQGHQWWEYDTPCLVQAPSNCSQVPNKNMCYFLWKLSQNCRLFWEAIHKLHFISEYIMASNTINPRLYLYTVPDEESQDLVLRFRAELPPGKLSNVQSIGSKP